MSTKLEAAVHQLAQNYAAFPMPIASNIAITAMVAGLCVLAVMSYFAVKDRPIEGRTMLIGVSAIGLAVIVLVLGNDASDIHQMAERAARAELAGDCAAIATAAKAQDPTTLSRILPGKEVRIVESVCGPQVMTDLGGRPTKAADLSNASMTAQKTP